MTETNQTDGSTPTPQEIPQRKPIRGWLALVLLALAIVVTLGIRLWPKISFQQKNIYTAQVVIISLFLELLWVLFLSRLKWSVRLLVFGSVVGVIALTAGLFRIHGVTGDLLPILEWRWKQPDTMAMPMGQPTPSARGTKPIIQTTNDFPQFLGPHRNAQVEGPTLARDWQAQPPQKLWSHPVGAGWSGLAVLDHYAVTQEQRGDEEMVVSYDLLTGKVLWSHADPAHYNTIIAGEGPRATPTIVSNRVYTLGATGILNCLDLETGARIWSKDIIKDNQAKVNGWGMAGSPLVVDQKVIVNAGGPNDHSLVAYDAATGNFVWGGGNTGADYSSPLLVTLAGVRQILIFAGRVSAHDVDSGKVLWDYPWPGGHPHIAIPVLLPGDRVLISSGYGTGSELLQIKKAVDGKWSSTRIWKSIRLKAKFTNVVYRDGFIYGLDDGILVCLDAADGSLKWKEGRYGHGQVILSGPLLLVMDEGGDVVLVEPVPLEHRELTRFTALPGKTWNPPALAGTYLVVRNDKEAACYRLPVAAP
ncbi:MAG: PQQ-like beta-propeller repeat protein [Verrucomicrobia subdivision 3 bacterium]|nr:PQQ-like beta-propeller repeat protein [Limisphaerales bacterium]